LLLGILAGGTSGGVVAAMTANLTGTAITNGWSVKAEEAADYGGFQYMLKSHYDPTGMLTAMERLAMLERNNPLPFQLGILRDHPPGRERAESLIHYMNLANVPIRRSRVAASFRADAKPADNGTVQLCFGGKPLVSLTGNDALVRADLAAQKLNDFFDSVPEAYEVQATDDGEIVTGHRALIDLTPADALAAKMPLPDLEKITLEHIRSALFTIGSRVWDAS
jgi:peptidase M48-like protein